MSFSYTPHITSQRLVDVDTDKVIAALQIPEGGVLNSWQFTSHLVGTDKAVTEAVFHEFAGYMVPVADPDASRTPDQLWDLQVVKDTALVVTAGSSELEIDTLDTAVTTVVDEPGVPALQKLMDDWGPDALMAPKLSMVSVANSIGGFKDATPDTYLPRAIVSHSGKGPWRAEAPMMALWAFGSPQTTATVTAFFEADTPAEWAQLQYLEYVLEQAFIEVIGLTETGAESPWADAATLVVNNLIAFFEETSDSFATVSWDVKTMFTASVTVPGTIEKQSLSLGW